MRFYEHDPLFIARPYPKYEIGVESDALKKAHTSASTLVFQQK